MFALSSRRLSYKEDAFVTESGRALLLPAAESAQATRPADNLHKRQGICPHQPVEEDGSMEAALSDSCLP